VNLPPLPMAETFWPVVADVFSGRLFLPLRVLVLLADVSRSFSCPFMVSNDPPPSSSFGLLRFL